VLDRLDAAAVRRWCAVGLAGLREHQHEIDELNVYPVPDGDTGTNLVLTVEAAVGALDGAAEAEGDAAMVLGRLARGALLGALARAGVVDAGGRGLVVLLDALVEVTTGEALPPLPPAAASRIPLSVVRETGSDEYAYEVQYLLDAPADAVDRLTRALGRLGDSLVVVGAGGTPVPTWNVHVHVNDAGAAIEAGVEAGRPHRISVTRFADQAPPAPPPAR